VFHCLFAEKVRYRLLPCECAEAGEVPAQVHALHPDLSIGDLPAVERPVHAARARLLGHPPHHLHESPVDPAVGFLGAAIGVNLPRL
jgi:hypothetical protein